MANVFIQDIEVDAKKLLGFLSTAQKDVPAASAALGVVLGAVNSAIGAGTAAASESGLNIALDVATVTQIKAVWPAVESLVASVGVKL